MQSLSSNKDKLSLMSLNNQDIGNGPSHSTTAASNTRRTSSATTTGGLLLLSTKKSVMNSNGNAKSISNNSNASVKKGISTHDALMNALNGDSGDKAKVPLAWGLKAPSVIGSGSGSGSAASGSGSASANVVTATSVSTSTVVSTPVNVAAASTTTTSTTTTSASNTGNTGHAETKEHIMVHDGSGDQSNYAKAKAISTPAAAIPTSDSNDNSNAPNVVPNQDANHNPNYNPNPNNNNPTSEMNKQQDPPAENQVDFMKKLAKERAEKRRFEEEQRVSQQKERAKQRLLELDLKKLQKKPPSFDNHNHNVVPSHIHSHDHSHNPNVNVNINVNTDVHTHTNTNTTTNTNTNAPSKPITSIVAGHNVTPQESISRFSDPSRSYSSLLRGGAGAGAVQSHLPESITATATGTTASGYMIHMSSYDDRDRGGRSAGAGPRMLFDPKSGSMVSVPVGGSNSSSKEKKSSKKKSPRDDRDKDKDGMHGNDRGNDRGNEEYSFQGSGSANGLMEEDEEDEDFQGSGTSRRSARYRQRAAKRSAKRDDKSLSVKPRKTSMGKHESTSVKMGRALPRSCGVLYKRDANGQFVSADGCEGDQGYGAHSVPGGRLRNSKAYSALKQKGRALGKQEKNNSTAAFTSNPPTDGFDTPAYLGRHAHSHPGLSSSTGDYDYNRGLNRSHFMRKSQQQPMAGTFADTSPEFPSSVLNVVTGDEKLDLLSGLDASPKLQATAAAWAPSEAVLALAAANSQKTEGDRISPPPQELDSESHEDISESEFHAMNALALIDNESGHDEEECHLEASPSIGLGLGFDPSQNMDSLMMSPAMEDETPHDVPGLSNFDLKESAALPKSSSNSFLGTTSILGSSTWGTSAAGNSNTMGSLSNWDLLGRAEDDIQKQQSPSAFLSLGQNTWGSGTAKSFNGFNIDSGSSD